MDLKDTARGLRVAMTDAEQLLWSRLRRMQLLDVQFYRQRPLGNYIVDFYAPRVGLVIEVDGAQHFDEPGRASDQNRDQYFSRLGLQVLRFDNRQVLKETDVLVQAIYEAIARRLAALPRSAAAPELSNSPVPPFSKGGSGE
jgi:very-short-patch-repair endonuclease